MSVKFRTFVALLALALALAMSFPVWAGENPFVRSGPRARVSARTQEGPAAFRPVMDLIVKAQRELRRNLAALGEDLRGEPFGASFWMFMLLSFVYGLVHALGPGHGKAFAAAYFLGRPAGPARAFAFGGLAMCCHVLSATIVVLAGYYVLRLSGALSVEQAGVRLEALSYGLLCLIGLGLTIRAARDLVRAGSGREAAAEVAGMKGLLATALAAGLAPCPGAALVLIFSISLGVPWAGLLAMAAISMGMGLTTSLAGLASQAARGLALTAARGRGRALCYCAPLLSLFSALGIAVLGGLLFFGGLRSGPW
ncbi:MAG: high-affinity nickel-transporter [Desulfovibrionaceae bacterium]|nr:high-affinity nickel-transporter [Desulfovibrionaceae bacterium]